MTSDSEGWSQRPLVVEDGAASGEAVIPNGFDPAAAYLEQLGEGSRRTMREALTKTQLERIFLPRGRRF